MSKAKSYQQLAKQLADILNWFERSDVDLDEAIAKYAEAAELVKQIEAYLKTAENRVKKINVGRGH